MKLSTLAFLATLLFMTALGGYVIGALSYAHNTWPLGRLKKIIQSGQIKGDYDGYDRLISYPGKVEVNCPKQTSDMGVILAIGQSNAANHGSQKFKTEYPNNVFNYFDGKCYISESPLLGASGEYGEFITPVADKLIESGTYKSVIIISSAIGGSVITSWQRKGYLNEMLLDVIQKAKYHYKITDVIWHQGENDYYNGTAHYLNAFQSLQNTLSENDFDGPFFISISTKCGNEPKYGWKAPNPTAIAQHQLIDNKKIFLGADTDAMLTSEDRRHDECHFSGTGLEKTASAYSNAIIDYHKSKPSIRH